MVADDPYRTYFAARSLLMAGDWDTALAVLPRAGVEEAAELRAQILVERHWWRLDDPAQATEAVRALPAALPHAQLLSGQLAYTRLLFGLDPDDGDEALAESAFQAAAVHPTTAGWGAFWMGVLRQNIAQDDAAARPLFDEALRISRVGEIPLLESYAVRHLAGLKAEQDRAAAELLFRRSLHLRAALGARPQTAAAQVTLAGELPEGDPERELLLEAARSVTEELDLTWLRRGFDDGS
ncbi:MULTISPECIES: hypothetical protein [unclassified Streptomyces]|uniref:hypothetical protein n=1 Tax=unclassified Streptomyces TaxID=2593676 RepID=UPI00339E112F